MRCRCRCRRAAGRVPAPRAPGRDSAPAGVPGPGRSARAADRLCGRQRRRPRAGPRRDSGPGRRAPAAAHRGVRGARGRRRARRGRAAAAPHQPAGDRRLRQVRHRRASFHRPALAGGGTMSAGLRAAARDYLSGRRARGYRLAGREWLLGAFLDGLAARGATRITVAGALAFATARPETSRCWQAKRLAVVREFAWYVHGIDPAAAEPIPAGLINARTARRVPYLYSEEQIARLMSAAALLPAPMLAASMQTHIGLLASTGLRSGEAGALDAGDLDAAAGLLTVTGKYGRIRLVALHSTAVQALTGYLRIRASRPAAGRGDRAPPEPDDGPQHLPVAHQAVRPGSPAGMRGPAPARFPPPVRGEHPHRRAPPGPGRRRRHRGTGHPSGSRQPGPHLLVPDRHPRTRGRRLRAGRPVLPARATQVTALAPTVESFFTGYLIGQRGASAHTIASYRDTLRLLFRYVHERTGIRPSELDVADLDAEMVTGFLAALEQARHNSAQTRNLRLAAIHSLFRHAVLQHPEHAWSIARVLAIRPRKASQKVVTHLTRISK